METPTHNRIPRVLYLHPTGAGLGGAESSLYELVTYLAAHAQAEPVVGLPDGSLKQKLEAAGITCVKVPMRPLSKSLSPWALWRMGRALTQTRAQLRYIMDTECFDLIHTNTDQAMFYAVAAGCAHRIPIFWHCRDLARLGLFGRWLATGTDRIIAISNTVAAHIRHYVDNESKLVTVPNGVRIAYMAEQTRFEAPPELHNLPPDTYVVGMIGQYVKWKNHAAFLRAAARIHRRIPKALFVILGTCRTRSAQRYQQSLKSLAAKLGIRDRVIFAEPVSDIRPFLHHLDCMVHPTGQEPFGRVIIEAMAAGRPVVALDQAGPGEIITHGTDGLLVPDDSPEKLANEVIRLHDSPALAKRLGDNAAGTAKRRFDISRAAAQIAALYREWGG